MKQMTTVLLVIMSLSLCAQDMEIQNFEEIRSTDIKVSKPNTFGLYVSPTIGSYIKFNGEPGLITIGSELEFYQNKLRFSLQYYRHANLVIFGFAQERTQIGLRIGSQTEGRLFRCRYQIGLAQYKGSQVYNFFEENRFSTLGLTTKVGIEFKPIPFMSIAFDLETNINSEESIFMPLIKIGIGKI